MVRMPPSQPHGLAIFFLGGLGVGSGKDITQDPSTTLVTHGLEVAIVLWKDSWLASAQGEEVGPARLGCRPATAIKWAYDHLYRPLNASAPALGACGFCITGNSGGSSQSAEALTFYGLAPIVNAAVLSGGPPHAALAKGCVGDPGFGYAPDSAHIIDLSYGFPNGGGPCERHDKSFLSHWLSDSLDTGGGDYYFPTTRVTFIFGTADPTVGPSHGKQYLAKLKAQRSPYVYEVIVPGLPHSADLYPEGRAALEKALLGAVSSS